jgi:hypothetical protein
VISARSRPRSPCSPTRSRRNSSTPRPARARPHRVIRAGYALLGLQTYFTVGPKEARAWTIHRAPRRRSRRRHPHRLREGLHPRRDDRLRRLRRAQRRGGAKEGRQDAPRRQGIRRPGRRRDALPLQRSGLDVPSRKPVTTEGGRIRPPMRLRGEANVDGVPPEPTGGSGTCRTGPEHVAPITGYGAKAPVGFPCWMSRSTPACHIGKERPIRGACRRASPAQAGTGLPHGASPRAPLPRLEGQS